MRTLLFTIAYDGRNYHGFQVQKNAVTVEQVFQDALEQVFGGRLPIKGCSRTDSGVHANHFCISMETDRSIPCDRVILAMNRHLPPDIAVIRCREVPEGFHARYSCIGKEYLYKILNRPARDPFSHRLALHYPYFLDVEKLNRASGDFVGYHDFSAFCSAGSTVEDTRRTIFRAEMRREGDMVLFLVSGDGFLYNMVRIMTGTLLEIARGEIPPDGIPEIIESKDRRRAGATAPPWGLYLNRVFYPGIEEIPAPYPERLVGDMLI